MRVPFFEVRHDDARRTELACAAHNALRRGKYILGPDVEAFEAECATYLKAEHAIGVSSGTDALIASLMALDIGPGDEVIVPAFTFVATAVAVARVGARPVFVDVRDDDLTMDIVCMAKAITRHTKAAIPVHLFGSVCSSTFSKFSIIEDAAQAFGSFVASRAATVCHSFFPTKNLAGFGDGGMVTTDDDVLARKLRAIRQHGSHVRYTHEMIGGNFRLDELQAALLRVQLRALPYDLTKRRTNVALYHAGLEGVPVRLPRTLFYGVHNQFVIRTHTSETRDALRAFLTDRGVGTEVYYPTPLHLQPCFSYLGGKRGDFPVAERAAREVLALPIFPGLREEEIEYVCKSIRAFFDTSAA